MSDLRLAKGIGLGMISTVLWGSFYPTARLLFGEYADKVEGLNISVIRFILAAAFMLPLFAAKRNRQLTGDMVRRHWRRLLVLGVIGIVGEGLSVFCALQYTTGARASLLANMSPIITMLISYWAGRELLNRNKISGMLVGFAGLVLVFCLKGEDKFTGDMSTYLGDGMALFSGVCWSVFTVFGDDLSLKYGGMLTCEILFIVGLLFMIPMALVINGGIDFRLPWQVWCGAFYLGVMSYSVGNSLWYLALKYVTPGELGALGYVSALIATSLSAFVNKEQMTVSFFVALALIIGGVALMLKRPKGQWN